MNADCATNAQLIFVTARGLVLFVAAISGAMSIFLGWKLYKDSIYPQTKGEASWPGYKIKVIAAGPGLFFALFGMWILVHLIDRPIDLSGSSVVQKSAYREKYQGAGSTIASRQSDAIINVADSNRQPTRDKPCTTVIETRTYNFKGIDGNATLDAEDIRASLDIAIRELRIRAATPGLEEFRRRDIVSALRTLLTMRNSIETGG